MAKGWSLSTASRCRARNAEVAAFGIVAMECGSNRMLTILCGLEDEAKVIKDRRDVQVLWGNARTRLDVVVARGCKALISFGVSGALDPTLKVGDLVLATSICSPEESFNTNQAWRTRLDTAVSGRAYETSFYCDGNLGASNAQEREKLYKEFNAGAIDDETIYAARFAHVNNIPFVALRSISDNHKTVIPSWISKTIKDDGSANIEEIMKHLDQTFDLFALAVNFGKALAALKAVYAVTGPQLCWEGK